MVQNELNQDRLILESTEKKKEDMQDNLVALENKRNALNEQVETLEVKIAEKKELTDEVKELEKLGFDIGVLRQLKEAITEIGAKHGLKGKEAAVKFFAELKGYDTKIGFEQEIHRLEIITSTKKLEAEKWQAEAETLSRHYKDLSDTIVAVQNLLKEGVKAEQIVSWNGIVSKFGGPGELQGNLEKYRSMSEFLTARKSEIDARELEVTKLSAQLKSLNEKKSEIEGAIKSLSTSGTDQIKDVSGKAVAGLNSLSAAGLKEINSVGDGAIATIKSLLTEMKAETKKLADLSSKAGNLEKELIYARYITTGDQAVLKSFPKEVVISFLERASVYCKLNHLNPKVRVPDGFSNKYFNIYSFTEVELIDIIRWAEAGLAGV
jgi:DNA repair exonuclease SbcCD ATPase subunit